jgi:hypothetical protein
VIPTLEQSPVKRLTSISRAPPALQRQETPTPPASQWRHTATRYPPSSELFRLDIGVIPVGDYSNKYYIKSGDTQFTGEKLENSVEPADRLDGESWRRTKVQTYRSTDVQWYRSTVVQIHVAIERMVAVGFRKRDPSLNY